MSMDVPHLEMVEPAIFSKIDLIKVDTVREEVVMERNLAILEAIMEEIPAIMEADVVVEIQVTEVEADVVVEIQVTEVEADVVVEIQATEVEVEADVVVTKIAEAKVLMALD